MAIDLDSDVRQADWLRTLTWDINPPTLSRLFEVIKVTDSSVQDKRVALQRFLILPAVEAIPTSLKRQVDSFLRVQKTYREEVSENIENDEVTVLPTDIEDQLPIIPNGVEIIEVPKELENIIFGIFDGEFEIGNAEQDLEKGLVSAAGRVLTFFRGLFGKWVTIGGRPVFIKVKGLLSSDVAVRDAQAASIAFKRLPRNMKVALGNVKVSNRNIVERLLPQKTPPFLVGKKLFRVSKVTHNKDLTFNFPKAPAIIERTRKVRGPDGKITEQITRGFLNKERKFVSLPDDAVETSTFYRGPGYTTMVRGKRKFTPFFDGPKQAAAGPPRLTIWPGRLRALRALKTGQKRSTQLGVADIINRNAGRAVYPTTATKVTEGLDFNLRRFEQATTKERGVTRYAERVRRGIIKKEGKTIERDGAIENFGELFMIFKRRNSKFKGQWNALQKTHPETIAQFFNVMQLLGITTGKVV